MTPTVIQVTIVAAGTAQRITTDPRISANSIFIAPMAGNAQPDTIYVGTSTLVSSTGVGLIYPITDPSGSFTIQCQDGTDGLSPYDYFLDGTNTGDVVQVTFWK